MPKDAHKISETEQRNAWTYIYCSCGWSSGPFFNSDYAMDEFDLHKAQLEGDLMSPNPTERAYWMEVLIAARDSLVALQKQCGWIPAQQGYSTTMTDAEMKASQAVRDLDKIITDTRTLTTRSGETDTKKEK